MKASTPKSFSANALAGAVAVAFLPTTTQAAVGRVDFAYGDVRGVSDSGDERRLTRGAEIREGDTVITNRGRAQLRFSDGARTSLLPNSEFRVDRYEYTEEAEEESTGFFSLLKGGLRTITGVIGRLRKEAYQVTTPSATIGIRGTEYLVVLGNSANVWVADGEIQACNDGGCTSFEGGESGYIADSNTKPIYTEQKPDTSGGEVETNTYSAAEDVNEDGTPEAVGEIPDDSSRVTTPGTQELLEDGPFYTLVSVLGAGASTAIGSALGASPPLVNATFSDRIGLRTYSVSGVSGSIGSANSPSSAALNDGTLGWGRWADGNIETHLAVPTSVTLTGDQSFHYAIGTPTVDMPTSGTAAYSLIGGTDPTFSDGSAVGTLTSATLNVDFGAAGGLVQAGVVFSIDGETLSATTGPFSPMSISGYTFSGTGSAQQIGSGFACSGSCPAYFEGFFSGAGASGAGLVYEVEVETEPRKSAIGAAGLIKGGPGSPIGIPQT